MVILYILGLMGWVTVIFIIFGICFHNYTKDRKSKDIKDKIDDYKKGTVQINYVKSEGRNRAKKGYKKILFFGPKISG